MEYYLGEIRLFAGNYAPRGWALCHGQTLAIAQYQGLYQLIGTSWGGDGTSTFQLPDLRGRLMIGSGHGPSLTSRSISDRGGSETVTLSLSQIPPHTHGLIATNNKATSSVPDPTRIFAAAASPTAPAGSEGLPYAVAGTTLRKLNTDTIGVSGTGAPHDNMMPCFAINHIIALTGDYPSVS